MKKSIVMFIGACLLVIAVGCSQTLQSSESSKKATSEHRQSDQAKKQKVDQPKNALASFEWEEFSNRGSNKNDKETQNLQDKTTEEGIIPTSIKIPAINVKTDVVKKGLVKKGPDKGQMATPDNAVETAWYKLGTKPGEKGSSVIAGHVDTKKGPGVFFNLKELKKGDLIYVSDKNGKTLAFKVYQSEAYPRDDAPVYKIFGYTAAKTLRLATCTGDFDYKADTHTKRLVVSAVLVDKNNPKT